MDTETQSLDMGHFYRLPLKNFKQTIYTRFFRPKDKTSWLFRIPSESPSVSLRAQECKNSAAMENSWVVPQKVKCRIKITLLPTNSTPSYILWRMEIRNSNKYLYTNVLAARFTKAKRQKQPKCPSVGQSVKKTYHIHTMEQYSATDATTRLNLNTITLSEKRQTQKVTYCMITFVRNT